MRTTLDELAGRACEPCRGDAKAMRVEDAQAALEALPGWTLSGDGKGIRRELVMKDFASAVELLQRVAQVADEEDHHPDLHLTGYRRLVFELSTHSIGGLSANDFILAAKIEKLPKRLKV